jgi:hypothetical protein
MLKLPKPKIYHQLSINFKNLNQLKLIKCFNQLLEKIIMASSKAFDLQLPIAA